MLDCPEPPLENPPKEAEVHFYELAQGGLRSPIPMAKKYGLTCRFEEPEITEPSIDLHTALAMVRHYAPTLPMHESLSTWDNWT
jgi:hypothetical protein